MGEKSQLRHRKPKDKGSADAITPDAGSEVAKKTKPSSMNDALITVVVAMLSAFSLFYNLSQPSQVVFDEVHFGGYASKYIQRKFFFDVHPPLAKMLIALMAKIAGYDGNFDFGTIGNDYTGKTVPYVQMRFIGALFGGLTVPMAYRTMRYGGHSVAAGLVVAFAVCYENSFIANYRLIMLDSFLIFFTSFTVMSWNKFFTLHDRPFCAEWWRWLALTGLGLGMAVSCKWVGLFVIATIGLSTIKDLWTTLGNLEVSKKRLLHHCMARVLCLIILPISVYIASFYIHFLLVPYSGVGDPHMSIEFQRSLIGNEVDDVPADITYGSRIVIRHVATNGGYLHSHLSGYPGGSRQQQVTLYPYRDDNNWWVIHKADKNQTDPIKEDVLGSDNKTWMEYVRNGDIVRLEHVVTSPRKLHSHDVKAPLTDTEYHKEVSCYGFPQYDGDANDFWRVIIESDDEPNAPVDRLRTINSKFRLMHVMQNCALFSHDEKLPSWGFGQQEVACIQSGKKPKTLWMIEDTENDLLPQDTRMINYAPLSFWQKLTELHKVMWTANAGLTGSHPFESRPSSWPMLRSGILFWSNDRSHIVFLGNPVVYWTTTISVFTFVILWAFFQFRDKRGFDDTYQGRRAFFESSAGYYVIGWLLHYLPFYLMKRQLFLHHYLPALYFAILVFGAGFDLAISRRPLKSKFAMTLAVCLAIFGVFCIFSPITYGTRWTREQCEAAKWLPTWDFGCSRYPLQRELSPPFAAVQN